MTSLTIRYLEQRSTFWFASPTTIGLLSRLEKLCLILYGPIEKRVDVSWMDSSCPLVQNLKCIKFCNLQLISDLPWQLLAKLQNLNRFSTSGSLNYDGHTFKADDAKILCDTLPNLQRLKLGIELLDIKRVLKVLNKLQHLHTLHITCFHRPGFNDLNLDQVDSFVTVRQLTIRNVKYAPIESVRKWIKSVPILFPQVKSLVIYFNDLPDNWFRTDIENLLGVRKRPLGKWNQAVFKKVYLKELVMFPKQMTQLKYFKLLTELKIEKKLNPILQNMERYFTSLNVKFDFVNLIVD